MALIAVPGCNLVFELDPVASGDDGAPVDSLRDGAPIDRGCIPGSAHDEDGDGHPDSCDVCPHVADTDQRDTTEAAAAGVPDGVGDACDPHPTTADRLVSFHGFDVDPGWTYLGPGWLVDGDQLVQTGDQESDRAAIGTLPNSLGRASVIVARAHIAGIAVGG